MRREFRIYNKKKVAASRFIKANRNLPKAVNNAHRCIFPGVNRKVPTA